ncbi:MAG: class II aldolase/adducin family protein [Pseudomonadota bacterium]
MSDIGVRQAIIDACLWMNRKGINQGTSGNISVRDGEGMLITPSGVPYDQMTPDMIVRMSLEGGPLEDQQLKPSSEWRFHQALIAARPDINAVVHAHPPHCTALAVQNRPIPACHYMVGAFGGSNVRIAPYSIFGEDQLSQDVITVMEDRQGCLMANHGALTTGDSLARALWRMEELEALARVYLLSHIGGAPVILSEDEMADVMVKFASYGLRDT